MSDIRALPALPAGQAANALVPVAVPGGPGLADVAYAAPLSLLVPAPYVLAAATTAILGGIKVGPNLTVAPDGTLTAIGAVSSVANRTGAIVLTAADVAGVYTTANPAGYQTATQVSAAIQLVIGTAPQALQTLAAIDAELANDESAAAALTTVVSGHTTQIAANTSGIASNTAAIAAREQTANKGVANGYAPLDGTGKVPSSNLPPILTAAALATLFATLPTLSPGNGQPWNNGGVLSFA